MDKMSNNQQGQDNNYMDVQNMMGTQNNMLPQDWNACSPVYGYLMPHDFTNRPYVMHPPYNMHHTNNRGSNRRGRNFYPSSRNSYMHNNRNINYQDNRNTQKRVHFDLSRNESVYDDQLNAGGGSGKKNFRNNKKHKGNNKSNKSMGKKNDPIIRNWTKEDALKAIDLEETYGAMKKPQVKLTFPDLELNVHIVGALHKAIRNVHFPNGSHPRHCFLRIDENFNVNQFINEISDVLFGGKPIKAEVKKSVEKQSPKDDVDYIDPTTLYVGNLPIDVNINQVNNLFPGHKRADVGYAVEIRKTRYAFITYNTPQEAFEAYKKCYEAVLDTRSLVVRFKRLNGSNQVGNAKSGKCKEDAPKQPAPNTPNDSIPFDSNIRIKEEPLEPEEDCWAQHNSSIDSNTIIPNDNEYNNYNSKASSTLTDTAKDTLSNNEQLKRVAEKKRRSDNDENDEEEKLSDKCTDETESSSQMSKRLRTENNFHTATLSQPFLPSTNVPNMTFKEEIDYELDPPLTPPPILEDPYMNEMMNIKNDEMVNIKAEQKTYDEGWTDSIEKIPRDTTSITKDGHALDMMDLFNS